MTRAASWGALLTVVFLLIPSNASAQYFGRNKVQYEQFDFRVLTTEAFDIYYYPREREAVEQAARLAERWHTRLAAVLDHRLRGRQPLVLYASHPDFRQTTVIGGMIGEGTGGVTERLQRRMVMPFTGSLQETSHVLGHELVHAFQFDMGGARTMQLPLWFIEGMAEYLSLGPVHAQTAIWLRDAAIHDNLPDFDELADPDYFPYRFGHAAWAYLAQRWSDKIVRQVFLAAGDSGDPLAAIEAATGVPIEELSKEWHASVRRTYAELDLTAVRPRGRALITEDGTGGDVNIGPALSPDGSRIAFLSEKDAFSIEVYVADATSGEILQKLTETATSPHIESIQFLQSTGAWSPDGRRFAVPAVKEGRGALRIVEVESGDVERDYVFDFAELGEVLNPAWSPDGRTIAMSGIYGGVSDLYLLTLDSGTLQKLTTDLYADLQPAWSPDGRTIVFVTDRFTTELASLDFGNYRMAAFDVPSARIRALGGFEGTSHSNPQFSPDGDSLYFVAGPNGIPNIYRMAIDGSTPAAVTSVTTGVTGITDLTPALGVAQRGDAIAYSVYADGKYSIYRLDAAASGQAAGIAQLRGAVLPPAAAVPAGTVARLLREPALGLPSPSAQFPTAQYDPNLDLTFVGAAAATSVGADELGARIGGGVQFLFSDVLGRHNVGLTVEASGGVQDIGAQVSYLNQASRWHWGGAVQRRPFRSGIARQFIDEVNGQRAIVEEVQIFRQVNYEASLLAQYPFNRSARMEFATGARLIDFDRDLRVQAFSTGSGRLIAEESTDLPAANSLRLGQASAAFAYDTSVFGATGPVLGTRSRLEVTPIFGGITFSEVVADYRRYVSPVTPFTIAARLMHFGRYGPDADSGRINPLFLGHPTLVRGYDVGSFDARECIADANGDCPAFDQLLGSRVLVGNLELRFPLVGVFTGEFDYGVLPVDGVLFAEAGVAWTGDVEPAFLGGERDIVRSVGAGLRVNAFGYLVMEFDAVRAFDRPDDNWRFVFAIRPGF